MKLHETVKIFLNYFVRIFCKRDLIIVRMYPTIHWECVSSVHNTENCLANIYRLYGYILVFCIKFPKAWCIALVIASAGYFLIYNLGIINPPSSWFRTVIYHISSLKSFSEIMVCLNFKGPFCSTYFLGKSFNTDV